MNKFIKKHKLIFIIIFSVIAVVLMPVAILNGLIGGLLYVMAAVVIENILLHCKEKRMQDETNALVMEIEKKNMVIAELQLRKEKQNENIMTFPSFELRGTRCNSNYSKLHIMLKNTSSNMVCGIESVSFEALSESITKKSYNEQNYMSCIVSGQEIEMVFKDNKSIIKIFKDSEVLEEICFIWKFHCFDTYGKIHYYKATLEVKDANDFLSKLWKVDKVG